MCYAENTEEAQLGRLSPARTFFRQKGRGAAGQRRFYQLFLSESRKSEIDSAEQMR